jgi:hypothetical protein
LRLKLRRDLAFERLDLRGNEHLHRRRVVVSERLLFSIRFHLRLLRVDALVQPLA